MFLAEFYDNSGHRTKRTAIESDDIDQVNFARDHPKDAASGVRIYSMDSYSETVLTADGKSAAQTHATLCPVPGCFMTGRPTYEFFRDFILNKDKPTPISSSTTPVQPGK